MNRIIIILLFPISLLFLNSCNKWFADENPDQTDSIPLKYVDLVPPADWIDIDNDNILFDTLILCSTDLYLDEYSIISLNPSIKI